jgi:hypothetical protein
MPWSVSSPMSRRLEFVEDARRARRGEVGLARCAGSTLAGVGRVPTSPLNRALRARRSFPTSSLGTLISAFRTPTPIG